MVDMSDVISWRTVIGSTTLALLGIVFNTTRVTLTGTELGIWVVISVLSAFLLVHGLQYARVKYTR